MKSKNSGFTLAEVLVSIVIGVISIAAAFSSYNYFNKSYKSVSQKAAINSSAREALSIITRDLRNAGYVDINYSGSDKDTKLIGLNKNYLDNKFDKLTIWYTTSPSERVQIEYSPKKYINDKYQGTNTNRMHLVRKSTFGSIIRESEFVPNIADFQVVFRNKDGVELTDVGDTSVAARANMKKVHSVEIYLTVESSKEVYSVQKSFVIKNDSNSLSFTDKYHRETFFASVHTRNLATPTIPVSNTGGSVAVGTSYKP
tara:strand:- start:15 stop:785 length:771 start_codon:yes stop_codon:yes gene_type:complete